MQKKKFMIPNLFKGIFADSNKRNFQHLLLSIICLQIKIFEILFTQTIDSYLRVCMTQAQLFLGPIKTKNPNLIYYGVSCLIYSPMGL